MKKEKHKVIRIVKNNKILLGYYFKFAPEMFFWRIFAMVMILFSDISFNIIFLKYVIDAMSMQVRYEIILFYIAGLAGVRILCDFANNYYNNYIEPVARLKMHKGIYNLIYEKIEKVDLEKFDDSSFYNDYIWALNEVDSRAKNTFNVVMQFLNCVLNVAIYSTLSAIYDKFVLLFVIIPVIANISIGMYRSKKNYELVSELTPVNRKRDYSRRSFYLRQYAKEIKTSGIGNVLRSNFNDCVDDSISITKKYRGKLFFSGYWQTHVGWLFSKTLCAAYMSYRVLIDHAYTVGALVVIYQAIGTFTNSLISLFSVVPKLQENGLFAERLIKIIHYESKIEDVKGTKNLPASFETLELKHVSFKYPNNERLILNDVSMIIEKGKKLAIVGLNGAGKSTLIKIILRFYDPTEGCVLLNGVNIKEYDVRKYREFFSTIFQDYQIFAVKLIENIFMRRTEKSEDDEAIHYLHESRLTEFDSQIEENVTKEFDKKGIVFSGGQSQKVAIARAFAKNADVVIMDEASSALDPIAESEINYTVIEKVKDRNLIIISHRLSTVQNVDDIYLLEQGKIKEKGSHRELIALGGSYAEMYNVQAEKYRESH